MRQNVKRLLGHTIGATDGEIGKVKEFYFDDTTWTIRYLVVETGNWLTGRKVLISPEALRQPDREGTTFPANLTREQVRNSPDIDTDQPVSRQQEIELYKHYPWQSYWDGGLYTGAMGMWGMPMPATVPFDEAIRQANQPDQHPHHDIHLRSTSEVTGYDIFAADGEIGEVDDFIIDENTWKITSIVADTGNWFPGKKVLLSPALIKEIKWDTSSVVVHASVATVKNSPEFDPEQPVSEDYEKSLYNHYSK